MSGRNRWSELVRQIDEDPVRRARVKEERRALDAVLSLLEAEGDSVWSAEAEELLDVDRQGLDERRARGEILALPVGFGDHAFPLWQFDDEVPARLLPGLDRVLGAFSVDSPLTRAEFFLAPNAGLGGRRPLDVLRAGEVEAVVRAAVSYRNEGEEG
jgi:hypothetical protein